MSSPAADVGLPPEQYLALERQSPIRHEYFDGCRHAMAGASRSHNRIVRNLSRRLSEHLQGSDCESFATDMRLRVSGTGLYTYPDLVVVCGEQQFDDGEQDTLLNPTLIVEVLSKSTESYDRGAKFVHYRRLESLREYVLVSQDRPLIERFTRTSNAWVLTEFTQLEGGLDLPSLGCTIPLQQIYENVSPLGPSLRLVEPPLDAGGPAGAL